MIKKGLKVKVLAGKDKKKEGTQVLEILLLLQLKKLFQKEKLKKDLFIKQ